MSESHHGGFRFYFLYSKISPDWQSRALQIASRVERRIAFALPFLIMERFAIVMPTVIPYAAQANTESSSLG